MLTGVTEKHALDRMIYNSRYLERSNNMDNMDRWMVRAGVSRGSTVVGGHGEPWPGAALFQWEFIFVRHYVRMWFTGMIVGLDR